MAYQDRTVSTDSPLPENEFATTYETRELAWELAQPRVDVGRVRFLIEMGAVMVDAVRLAQLTPRDIARHPQLRGLHLLDDVTAAS